MVAMTVRQRRRELESRRRSCEGEEDRQTHPLSCRNTVYDLKLYNSHLRPHKFHAIVIPTIAAIRPIQSRYFARGMEGTHQYPQR